jgi:hypothetical protein
MSARQPLFLGVLLSFLLVIGSYAFADNVSVTGTGYLGADTNGLTVNAGAFTAGSGAPGGPGFFLGATPLNAPLTITWTSSAFSGFGYAAVNVGTQFTDILSGGIQFTTPTFSVPASALLTGVFTAPVTVIGELQAFQDLLLGNSGGGFEQGPLMATLNFTGTGLATFHIQDAGQGLFTITVATAQFTGAGTLTTVPEPGSLLLMGTGFASLLGSWRFRRFFAH